MSMQAVRDFWQKIKDDSTLREKLESLGGNSRSELHKKIVPIAAAAGFSFTLEEYDTAVEERLARMHAAGEVTDEEMSAIVGGAAGTGAACNDPCSRLFSSCSWFVGN